LRRNYLSEIYEEIIMLVLNTEKGTVLPGYYDFSGAGAVLAELLLNGSISIEGSKKQLVKVHSITPKSSSVLAECFERIKSADKPVSLKRWVYRLGTMKKLRYKMLSELCSKGILVEKEQKYLKFFTRRIYKSQDLRIRDEIVKKLRDFIVDRETSGKQDKRTVILLSIIFNSGLLKTFLNRKEIKEHKKQIAIITSGEVTGKEVKKIISAYQSALAVAAAAPAIFAGTYGASSPAG